MKCRSWENQIELLYFSSKLQLYRSIISKITKCDCGPFGNCTFVNGSKICKCQEGYSLHNSKCEKCDCGKDESTLCILRYNYKECRCKKNYSQRTGYFPKYGKDTRCDYCNCGDHGECIFDGGYKKCICEENYLERSGKCEECSCGEYGTCKFREGDRKKICICEYGYADQNGKCVACNCNPIDLRGIGNCSYVDNTKQCDCPNGYQFSTTFFSCEDINECLQGSVCPSSTNCVNVPGSFQCECKRGYKLANDWDNPKEVGCADVDECSLGGTCSSGTTRCINTLGSYDCVCREGYYATAAVQGDTYMPMYNVCYGKQTQWEGATIAIAVILVCGIILACCSIVNRKCN
ncbi:hypothetical protein TNCT_491041 [Trichonephila clavata]|uniref:EGF-like domain-containing protein n=1 Tax=Trichonephila clavata TaxID=2740835 RepID=A0A8X6LIG3_TRICU|nr:hypothetical protein TNCT_491041 [Trichonephila clavata]